MHLFDLHAHFPMHTRFPPVDTGDPFIAFKKALLDAANAAMNYENGVPRMSAERVAQGAFSGFASVLYDPEDEFLVLPTDPSPHGLAHVLAQAEHVEDEAADIGLTVARDVATVDHCLRSNERFLVHCVEGGFACAGDPTNVATLAELGVAYMILAHLTFRHIATCANSIPRMPDPLFHLLNPQNPLQGLTPLGFDLANAAIENGIILDVTHCTHLAQEQLFEMATVAQVPVISSHCGIRRLSSHEVNLSDHALKRIAALGGVVGVIAYPYWLQQEGESGDGLDLMIQTIEEIAKLTHSYDHVAIGTDMDGFIQPVKEVPNYSLVGSIEARIRADYPHEVANKILWGNALRVLKAGWTPTRRPALPGKKKAFVTRDRLTNAAGNQSVVPLRLYTPKSLEDLVQIVADAREQDVHVRAVGSMHSWSDVALTPDFAVEPRGLDRVLTLDTTILESSEKPQFLVEVESGITLRRLNKHLDEHGLALPNMGGYDGQTIVGATATSTHGSGTRFGPLTEMIRSFDLVGGTGTVYRVEPATGGPTNRSQYEKRYGKERTLVTDDDAFHAVGVGLGCFGLVYSVILQVRDAFFLKEVRTVTTWEKEKEQLRQKIVFNNDHYELLLNPYAIDGSHTCLVTVRNDAGKPPKLPPDKAHRNFIQELAGALGIFTGAALRFLFDTFPDKTPKFIDDGICGLEDDSFHSKSFKVFNIGSANHLPSLSAEYAFDMDRDEYIAAVDAILDVAADAASAGRIYQAGPIAIRFVKGTNFLLSPQFRRDTAMVECIVVSGTIGCEEMLFRYEETAYRYEGRPHWGQINHIPGDDKVREMYPGLEIWREQRTRFDPDGRFDSPFTERLGL